MSRLGKKPVEIPSGVEVVITGQKVKVKGPKGELNLELRPEVTAELSEDGKSVLVQRKGDSNARTAKAMHGLFRSLIKNMIIGVKESYMKKLEIFGTGYLAALAGNVLQIRVGFANEVHKEIPVGLTVVCPDQLHVHISGCDKQLVGQFAAEIRAIKKADPYLGKGIKYEGEVIRRKESKAAGKK